MDDLLKRIYETYIDSLRREAKHHRQYAKQRKGEVGLIELIMKREEEIKTLEGKIRTLNKENNLLKTKKK